jgi:hypothetical protein
MRKRFFVCLAAGAFLAAAGVARAQEKVLVFSREVVKPGKATAHEKWEAGFPAAYAKANWTTSYYLAMTALSGEPRVLFMAPFNSLADWEKDFKAQEQNEALSATVEMLAEKDGDFLSEVRNAVALYQPDLSYNADFKVGEMRYFVIYSVHVKPGHVNQFEEVRKLMRAAHEKAKVDEHYAVYQLTVGAPAGTYLIIIPFKSLAEYDNFSTEHGKAYQDALGEEGRMKLREFAAQGQESPEINIFAFSPKMSYVPKETVDYDPEFWAPKPKAKPAAEKKKPEKKTPPKP